MPDFDKILKDKLVKDTDQMISELATFINMNVIDRKWQEGFPGHTLQPKTIKRKGHNRIGENTGALRRAATLWTSWTIFPFSPGTFRPAFYKAKRGLTDYALAVRTKVGGDLDFLGVTSEDVVRIETGIKQIYAKKNYGGTGRIRMIRR